MRSLKKWWNDDECHVCGEEYPEAEFWDYAGAFLVFGLGIVLGGLIF